MAAPVAVTIAEIEATWDGLFGECAPDGTLQAIIDAGHDVDFDAELQELIDDRDDRAYFARGSW